MRGLLKEFEADFQAATKKAEEEAELARRICPRVTVNKWDPLFADFLLIHLDLH